MATERVSDKMMRDLFRLAENAGYETARIEKDEYGDSQMIICGIVVKWEQVGWGVKSAFKLTTEAAKHRIVYKIENVLKAVKSMIGERRASHAAERSLYDGYKKDARSNNKRFKGTGFHVRDSKEYSDVLTRKVGKYKFAVTMSVFDRRKIGTFELIDGEMGVAEFKRIFVPALNKLAKMDKRKGVA